MSLEQLMDVTVQAATLHEQDPRDAPASITVITREQIRERGYRTLGEALNWVRGFYVTYDYTYSRIGSRGYNLPGDFSTRFLALLDGHNMVSVVDNTVATFGQDFMVDMNLVERIEIIRGPGSALYGANGIFATINVVTRKPEDFPKAEVRAETGSLGEKKLQAAGSVKLGRSGAALLSMAVLNNRGQGEIYLPEHDTPATNYGRALNMDGEKGYHLFGRAEWKRWTFTGGLSERMKIQPVSWAETVFNDRGTRAGDRRTLLESRYTRESQTTGRSFTWRTWYDYSQFHAIFRYPSEDGTAMDCRENDHGHWVGTQAFWRLPAGGTTLTVGAETRVELHTELSTWDVSQQADAFVLDRPDRIAAVFLQDEWQLSRHWSFNIGVRGDASKNFGGSATPRAGRAGVASGQGLGVQVSVWESVPQSQSVRDVRRRRGHFDSQSDAAAGAGHHL
jgi:outer membrane receptor for ferrienterochelin and colicins